MIRALALAVAALGLLVGCTSVEAPEAVPQEPLVEPAPLAPPAQEGVPRSLLIPSIKAESSLIPLGVDAAGGVEVPPGDRPEQAGWFRPGPEPGEVGASVVLGHVDGGGRPGVLARADELNKGDEIKVDDHTFTVIETEWVTKDGGMDPEKVFKPSRPGARELRLITCGGNFDDNTGHYEENLIVYAELNINAQVG